MQHEITRGIPLLDETGTLTEPGYAKRLLPVYDRSRVRCGAMRLKEWDYYLVMNERFGLALTIADNAYMGLDSVSFLNFEEGWQVTKSPIRVMPMGSTGLPASSGRGNVGVEGRGYGILFHNDGATRTLTVHMDKFRAGRALDAHIVLADEPEESMVVCTPFEEPGCFYYNQKINCMRASGRVTLGEATYEFGLSDSFGTLDWGRGVWPYQNTWYWGSASGVLDGIPFGFNVGCGFGDTSSATENMLFYNGKAHKLSKVRFHMPKYYMTPWKFTCDDDRFWMDFVPMLDRSAFLSVGVLKSVQHQVFGRFTGRVRLDDGTELQVKDLLGFAEKVDNRW
ncbi:MAG: DUF2804 domain-containing protein [Clostridia bacterium]|nr:DUF2804 domain-containing protein [Clostridia bacterium]